MLVRRSPPVMNPSSRSRSLLVLGALLVLFAAAWFWLQRTSSRANGSRPAATADGTRATSTAADKAAPAAIAPAAVASADDVADFRAAFDAARNQRDARVRSAEVGRVLQAWLARDREAALNHVRQLPPSEVRTLSLLMILRAIGEADPDRALRVAAELATTRDLQAFYSDFFARQAERDPAAAAQRLGQVPAGAARENALRALGEVWARRDFATALAWGKNLAPGDRESALESIIGTTVATDPLRAIQYAQSSLSGEPLQRTLAAALQKLTPTDPGAAAEIVRLLPAGEMQTFAALDVARALAAQNPAQALAWQRTLPSGDAARLALNNIIEVWAVQDPTAAGQYAANLPAGAARAEAINQFARTVGARAPEQAIAWARALSAGEDRASTFTTIASAWAQHDPVAATRWAAAQPADVLPAAGLNAALSYWMLRDPAATLLFVGALPPDQQRPAAEFVAPLAAQHDPRSAFEWARKLSPETSTVAMRAVLARWLDNDPAAAKAWADQTLTSKEKADLLPSGR
jgi:hypothetical protein